MKMDLVKIGNSIGLRIPAAILKQCNMSEAIDLTIEDEKIILRPIKKAIPRQGWDEAFKRMSENGDDKLLIDDTLDIMEDWEWK